MKEPNSKYSFPARVGHKQTWEEADPYLRLRLSSRIRAAASWYGKLTGRRYSVSMRGILVTVKRGA